MNAKQWTNGIGWDIRTTYGTAEVRDMVSKLRCFVPLAPRREWRAIRNKWAVIDRFAVADFPLEAYPVACVAATITLGRVVEDGDSIGRVPFVATAALEAA